MRERARDGIKRYTAVTSGEHLADQNFSSLLQCSGSAVAADDNDVIAFFFFCLQSRRVAAIFKGLQERLRLPTSQFSTRATRSACG